MARGLLLVGFDLARGVSEVRVKVFSFASDQFWRYRLAVVSFQIHFTPVHTVVLTDEKRSAFLWD